jgi:hypothetical protein
MSCSNDAAINDIPNDPVQLDSLIGKKVLFVYGGWEGHQPQAMHDLYVPWLESIGAEVVSSNSLESYADTALMNAIDLIIQTWTLGEISQPQLNGLLKAVSNGTGFAGWHGGVVDAFRNELQYHLMTGGQFLSHPGGIVTYAVNVTAPNDPIMHGLQDFAVNTEQYYVLTDPTIEVLATTTFTGEHDPLLKGRTIPVIWKHRYGEGRVFVNTIGHKIEDHAIPEFETSMRRGIVWACR